ncbi:LysR family transcriptional regulator [Ancylobacter pratisalsi]|uniref:LysR family transcriptional regulator n=1 Tax=Ancylobacter pratisalsi TaxID=1745854 RepID=A0A6P1YKI4_9HYPH|nr:LysR family transcriptional regulator [Ancylobacter pratisalsi]QIB33662.1 LysR family transcriptional regulator [Ancylobacter pratisalsi]
MNEALDLDTVETFLRVAELASFTRAAELAGISQSAVSLKLRKLEARLGRVLLERTPRHVRLTADGERFLPRARALVLAERDARLWEAPARRLRIGVSDHVVGDSLAMLLRRLDALVPGTVFEMRVGFSRELLVAYDSGEIDAAIVRREADRRDGEELRRDAYGWFAAPERRVIAGEAVPLALLEAPCGVRAHAIRALGDAGIAWREAFVGGGVAAVAAAVTAGLAVAPLAARLAPAGSRDIGPQLGLPPLPHARIMLVARAGDGAQGRLISTLAAAFRG